MKIEKLKIIRKYSLIKKYGESIVSKVVYNFLFFDKTYRDMDAYILNLDSSKTNGYESMGIVRHYGLNANHKNIFGKYRIDKAIDILKKNGINEYKEIIDEYDGNWGQISGYQKLPEDFIREFQDKVDWDFILMYQSLSEDFKNEFKDKLNLES